MYPIRDHHRQRRITTYDQRIREQRTNLHIAKLNAYESAINRLLAGGKS